MDIVNLSLEQTQEGISQCIATSRELINGAKCLGKKRLFEQAYSLVLLAAEERGKAILIYRTILLDENDITSWRRFWSDFRDHHIKLLAGTWCWADNFFNLHWDTQFGKSIEETQQKFISEFNLQKQLGLYVFFNEKNKKFERIKMKGFIYEAVYWCIDAYIQELAEIEKSKFFSKINLNKLKSAFTKGEGKELLKKYKDLKRLKTDKTLNKEYDKFLEKNGLNELQKLIEETSRKSLSARWGRGPHIVRMAQLAVKKIFKNNG
jgi:AbiV family abortive infection protein